MMLALVSGASIAILAGGHPALHPSGADVYVEVPDVAALRGAYSSAPALRFIADKEVRKLGEIAAGMGLDLQAAFESALPPADPAHPENRFALLDALRSASFSVTGLAGPRATSEVLLARTDCLAVLDFDSAEAPSRAITAIVGLLGLEPLPSTDGAPPDFGSPKAEIACFRRKPRHVEGSATKPDGSPAPASETKLWTVTQGPRLFLAIGPGKVGDLADRASARKPGFAPSADALPQSAGVTVCDAWMHVPEFPVAGLGNESQVFAGVAGQFMDGLLPIFVSPVGARGHWRTQLRGDLFVTEGVYERIGAARAEGQTYAKGPLPAELAARIPKEAVGAWITTVETAGAQAVLRGLREASAAMRDKADPAPAVADESAAACEARMAKALGSGVFSYLLPFAGMPMGGQGFTPRVVLAVEMRDPKEFQAGLEEWGKVLNKGNPALRLESRPYHKLPVFVLNRGSESAKGGAGDESGGGSSSSWQLAVAILPDRVILTMSPSLVKSEIRRIEEKKTEPHAIADKNRFPSDAFEAGSMDWAGLVAKLYDLGKAALPMFTQGQQLPFDPTTLPPSSALTSYFAPSFSWSRRVDGKVISHSESSFGPETPLGIAALVWSLQNSRGPEARAPKHEDAIPETTTPTADLGVATKKSLREVKTGLAVCRGQKGTYPARLEALLEPSAGFPKGFLDSPDLLRDEWAHPFAYELAADGKSFKLWSLGPDGVDQHGGGDDLTLP